MRLFSIAIIASTVALAGVPAQAQPAPADLVSVSAHVTFPTGNQSGADEGSCFISNNVAEAVRVRLNVRVIYSDAKVRRLTGISDPGVLGPGDAYELSVFFVIPDDASLGTAQFVCDVTAQASRGQREIEVQSATFDVVP